MQQFLSIHASAFGYRGAGCMILGEPGAGKSRLVTEAIALGAELIGDDQLQLFAMHGMLMAQAVSALEGVLELRGIGLVKLRPKGRHAIHLAVSLDEGVTDALAVRSFAEFQGLQLPHLRVHPQWLSSAAPLLVYLQAQAEGRVLPTDWRPSAS